MFLDPSVIAMLFAKSVPFEALRILIVDDNAYMRTLIKQVLRSFEVRAVEEAADQCEALLVLRSFHPDLVLVERELKPLDGIDFAKRLRRCPEPIDRTVPIIMISADATRCTVLAARDAGINEFLVQPMRAASLRSRIQAAIERPRPLVETAAYCGPCRRRTRHDYEGPDRRAREQEVTTHPLLSQEEINALMRPEEAFA